MRGAMTDKFLMACEKRREKEYKGTKGQDNRHRVQWRR